MIAFLSRIGFSLSLIVLASPRSAVVGQQLENLAAGYSSLAGQHTPMWIAVEDRIGRKYGIDLKAIYAGRLRPEQLLMSGDVLIVVATGSDALTSYALGSKDHVIVAINMNKVGGGIFLKAKSEPLKIYAANLPAFHAPVRFPK
jgi:hypothetical protein